MICHVMQKWNYKIILFVKQNNMYNKIIYGIHGGIGHTPILRIKAFDCTMGSQTFEPVGIFGTLGTKPKCMGTRGVFKKKKNLAKKTKRGEKGNTVVTAATKTMFFESAQPIRSSMPDQKTS